MNERGVIILWKYYINKIFSALLTLFIISTMTFFMMKSIPGGPFSREKPLPEATIRALEKKYNMDKPDHEQYFDYLVGLIHGDLGPSFQKVGVSVNELLAEGIPQSAKIGLLASVLIILLGIPIGIMSALKQNTWVDYLVTFIATLGVTIPSFVVGTLMIYFFAVKLSWIPTFGLDQWTGYIAPVVALSGYSLSFVTRLTRSSMLEVLRQDYIRTARANGLSEFKIIAKHALKNALIPVITYIGPMVAAIMTGSFVIEKIFAINGIGKYFVESISNRDYTVIMGMTIFYALLYIVMVLLVDVAYSIADPRIRMGGKE